MHIPATARAQSAWRRWGSAPGTWIALRTFHAHHAEAPSVLREVQPQRSLSGPAGEEVDVDETEAFGETECPFQIIQQRPSEVALHIACRCERGAHRMQVPAEIVHAQRIGERAAR